MMANGPKPPAATVVSSGATVRSPLLRPLLRRGRVVAAAALALGLSGCSPLHLGMMGAMMGMGQHTVEQSQSCQALATAAQVEARQWSALAADSVRALLPTHRRSVEAMLARCAADSTGRAHEATHAERTAIASDIRADLERMEQMSADSLRVFLPEHAARLDRFAALSGAATPRAIQERHDDQRPSAAQRPSRSNPHHRDH